MRIAFASEENEGLMSKVSNRFGRAAYFIIVDTEDGEVKEYKIEKNPGAEARGGAGIKAVQKLINEGAKIAVAGSFGPNAMTALEETGIKHVEISGVTVEEALRELRGRGLLRS